MFLKRNLIQTYMYNKTHQIAPFKKNCKGHAPEPHSKAHDGMQILKSKKNSCPPLPNPGYAPVSVYNITNH